MNDKDPDLEVYTRLKVWGRYYFVTELVVGADGLVQIRAETASRLSREFDLEFEQDDKNREPHKLRRS